MDFAHANDKENISFNELNKVTSCDPRMEFCRRYFPNVMSLKSALNVRKRKMESSDDEDDELEIKRESINLICHPDDEIRDSNSVETKMDSLKLMTPKKIKKQQKITNFYKKTEP
jgi:hypothetical protein